VEQKDWVEEMVRGMLRMLVPLSLKRTPMADTLPDVVVAWSAAFRLSRQALSEEVDAPRFRRAFTDVYPTLREWPAPADFIERLQPRPPQKMIDTGPVITEEDRVANLRMLRDLQARLAGGVALTENHHNERARAEAHARAREA